jgi:GNAT superfamily N-acetyltransferase
MGDIRVRPARGGDADDRAFLRAMAPRLETGMPPWIAAGTLAAAVARSVLDALQAGREGEAILVAEDAQGRRLGFVYVTTTRDGLSDEPLGYVSEFAVAADAEGRGAARALLDAAEQWSRGRGARAMMLRVFSANTRARAVYEHLGYEPDVLQLRKRL